MTRAYYNEFNPDAAQWLRELIAAGHIAPGDVDTRSIEDVRPTDLVGYDQCHFFAGIGIWSRALRLAGCPDDRPVWTGSCPCQPFSTAGKGAGLADERHLWPAWYHLILHGKPTGVPIYGEQVANGGGLAWLDLVSTDLEAAGYAFRAVDLCAAGFGAPHIRQRLFFHAIEQGRSFPQTERLAYCRHDQRVGRNTLRGAVGEHDGTAQARQSPGQGGTIEAGQRSGDDPAVRSPSGGMDIIMGTGEGTAEQRELRAGPIGSGEAGRPGPTNGAWAAADWLLCKDGKWRPVEPGTHPLVDGTSAGVATMLPDGTSRPYHREIALHGFGNGIVAQVAAAFITSTLHDVTPV